MSWYYGWCLLLKELKGNLKVERRMGSSTADEIMRCCRGSVKPMVPILSQINPLHALISNFRETHLNTAFPSRPTFPSGIFPLGLHTIPLPALGFKPCNLTCLAWCTFLHVATGFHLPCSSFLLHGWIMLPAFNWIILDLTQLRHSQLVVQYYWGHAPWGMSALHRRTRCWPMEESVAPSTTGRCWLVSSGTLNPTDISQPLSNLCTRYSVVTNPIRS
jgi:hypothetical protein